MTAGTRGDTAGLAAPDACLAGAAAGAAAAAAAAAAAGAEVEDVGGLASEGGDGAEAVVRGGVSESLESTGTEPLLVDAEEEMRRREDSIWLTF